MGIALKCLNKDYLPGNDNKASNGESRLYITPVSLLPKDFIRALFTCCLVFEFRTV